MANVLNKTTGRLIMSADTASYPEAEWFHNPDLSNVGGVAIKYWRAGANPVEPMDQAERDAVDAAEQVLARDSDRRSQKDEMTSRKMRALLEILLNEFNTLRSGAGLAPRTLGQLATAIDNKIDGI